MRTRPPRAGVQPDALAHEAGERSARERPLRQKSANRRLVNTRSVRTSIPARDQDHHGSVDDLGQPLSGSATTAIVAVGVLGKNPGATILHNCICSKAVPEVVRTDRDGTVRLRVVGSAARVERGR